MELTNADRMATFHRSVIQSVITQLDGSVERSLLLEMQGLWEGRLLAIVDSLQPEPPATKTLWIIQHESRDSPIQATIRKPAARSGERVFTVEAPAECFQVKECAARLARVLKPFNAYTKPAEITSQILQQLNEEFSGSMSDRVEPMDDANDTEEEEEEDEGGEESQTAAADGVNGSERAAPAHFENSNLLICKWKVISKKGNRWEFHLNDGILNIDGRDYVFNTAETGRMKIPRTHQMPYRPDSLQIYRKTTIGTVLVDLLSELVEGNRLSQDQAAKALKCFDKSMFQGFESHGISNKVSFKVGNVVNYHRDNALATTFMRDVQFNLSQGLVPMLVSVEKLKVVSTRKP